MSEALVVILVLLWALVLLPGAVRSRRSSPRATVGGFERTMEVLRHGPGRSSGRTVLVPDDAERLLTGRIRPDGAVLARRRRIFTQLAVTTAVTGLLAVTLQGPFVVLLGLMAASLATYIVLLLRWKAQRHRAARVVRTMSRRPSSPRGTQDADQPQRIAVGGDPGVPPHHSGAVATEAGAGVRVRRWSG